VKTVDHGPIRLYDLEPVTKSFLEQVVDGLSQRQKAIPCKFFYDAKGAAIFEEITQLEEYYPTRLESQVMEDMAGVMARTLGARVRLVEFGSGSSTKTRLLLSALDAPTSYVPIDISREHLVESALAVQADYPDLVVQPLCADYTQEFELPPEVTESACTVAYFPGSTIGNFGEEEAREFLAMVARRVGANGALILGVDRYPAEHHGIEGSAQKPKTIDDLHWAYNDSAGVTARFNLNLLERMRAELDAEVEISAFQHEAIFDEAASRIEMRLVSREEQTIKVDGHEFRFAKGEHILTEHSHKYDGTTIERLIASAGFPLECAQSFSDDDGWFAVYVFLLPQHPRARAILDQ
jgi:L-histidine Nalpha-methyltransferase